MGVGTCSPREFSKLGCSDWLKMNFTQQNSLTLLVFFFNSLTFFLLLKFPDIFRFSKSLDIPVYGVKCGRKGKLDVSWCSQTTLPNAI